MLFHCHLSFYPFSMVYGPFSEFQVAPRRLQKRPQSQRRRRVGFDGRGRRNPEGPGERPGDYGSVGGAGPAERGHRRRWRRARSGSRWIFGGPATHSCGIVCIYRIFVLT